MPLLIDAAQSAGVIPIDMAAWRISAMAFTGHKSLLGPTGIGGLVIHPELDVQATRFGGTGVDSKSLMHTQTFPHRLECGTLNFLGIIGLAGGLDFVMGEGPQTIHQREMDLLTRLRDGLYGLERVELYCGKSLSDHVGLITGNVKGIDPADAWERFWTPTSESPRARCSTVRPWSMRLLYLSAGRSPLQRRSVQYQGGY